MPKYFMSNNNIINNSGIKFRALCQWVWDHILSLALYALVEFPICWEVVYDYRDFYYGDDSKEKKFCRDTALIDDSDDSEGDMVFVD
jgi:hypothetical protein